MASTKGRPATQSDAAPASLWALARDEAGGATQLNNLAEVEEAYSAGSRLWIDLASPDRALLDEMSRVLDLHELVAEDISERNQRAKVELTGEALHVVMFALHYDGEIISDELDIVLGSRFLLTSHDGGLNLREGPFARRDPARHLAGGPDYLLWSLADWVVDGYFPVFDRLGDEIDELQNDVMTRPSSWIVERLFQLRRDLLLIRHSVSPQREIFNQLTNRDLTLIKPERVVYFRDVYDHLIRLTDELDSFRELVGTTIDIYLSQINNNLSETMKRLTAVTIIVAGAGAVAGIFGMSEAGLALGFEDIRFWIVTAAIVLASLGGLVYFRRIGWI
jgi:magnesium transporter